MPAPKIFLIADAVNVTGLSRWQIRCGIKDKSFPHSFKLGGKLAWLEHDILIWRDEQLETAQDAIQ